MADKILTEAEKMDELCEIAFRKNKMRRLQGLDYYDECGRYISSEELDSRDEDGR